MLEDTMDHVSYSPENLAHEIVDLASTLRDMRLAGLASGMSREEIFDQRRDFILENYGVDINLAASPTIGTRPLQRSQGALP
ncbi:MAG: hypothetical protein MRY63_06050 [Neomegalonema sp.]|nr:hypothetical protein [Neomegalonema sp.]